MRAEERYLAARGFVPIEADGWRIYLAPALIPHQRRFVQALAASFKSLTPGVGNRRGASPILLEGLPPMYRRHNRRGGLMARLSDDVYLGFRPRPWRELEISLRARERGVAIAEPLAAAVAGRVPGLYRGWFVTRALAGVTLWEFLGQEADPQRRAQALLSARRAIEQAHQAGLFHADLNLQNLVVEERGEEFACTLLDLDKARLYEPPLGSSRQAAVWRRVARSARKLQQAGGLRTGEIALLLSQSG
jgi:hypothetical protein